MRYCRRLLQTDIFPQKLSRRSRMVILAPSSLKAWMSTGTSSLAQRNVLATARSSPKFGSVTSTPSISSWCALNKSAHLWASTNDSTAPNRLASTGSVTALIPSSSSTRKMSRRPDSHKCAGKNPRFPIMMPSVVTAKLLLLLGRGGNLFGRFENVAGGQNNAGEIVRLEIEHAATAAAFAFHGAHDENAQRFAIEREGGSAHRGRGHRGIGNVKKSRPLHDGGNAFDRRGISSSGGIAETIQRDDLV